MDGLKEALELIQNTAKLSQAATMHRIPNNDRSVLMQINGTLTPHAIPPPVRAHQVRRLEDLICYANAITDSAIVIWHDIDSVVLVCDDFDRRDRVTFPLTFSERFAKLRKLAADKPAFDQAKFVRLLRIELGLNQSIVNKFRKLDWENGDKSAGEVRHGDTRLAKTVVAKVQGIDDLPNELAIEVPVYQQQDERHEYIVNCAVEIDAVNRMFQLIPLPDELERVVDVAQASIRSRIQEGCSTIPVYYGKP